MEVAEIELEPADASLIAERRAHELYLRFRQLESELGDGVVTLMRRDGSRGEWRADHEDCWTCNMLISRNTMAEWLWRLERDGIRVRRAYVLSLERELGLTLPLS